jgi:hypothetical protein
MAWESIREREVHQKKKIKGFPMFFTIEIFKRAFLGDMKHWSSRHHRRRHRYGRRHRRSDSKFERKMKKLTVSHAW